VGSKEGILLISLAFLDKGDKVLVPDPGYPTYSSASRLAEAEILTYDLKEDNGWKPDFEALEKMDLSGVKIMWTNYPNMPTGASATEELYAELVAFGRRHGILICNDNPYSFILNDNPMSILSQPGAKDCCLELNSLSKAHNMAGWRIGMVAADAEVISQILKVKSQMDSGMFKPLQLAAVKALEQGSDWFAELNDEYRRRRVLAGEIFDMLGVTYDHSSAGMFLWGRVPQNVQDDNGISAGQVLSDRILYEAGVFITPGFIFGKRGENYIRISLCAKPDTLREAAERIRRIL
jgi:aspartate/methionine/tyrosine aminotransferase